MASVLLDEPDRSRFPQLVRSHLKILEPGVRMGRIYQRNPSYATPNAPTWDTFRFFGPVAHAGRFDHHPPPAHLDHWRGVSYCAYEGSDLFGMMLTCLVECFRYPDNHVDLYEGDPHYAIFSTSRRISLLDVESDWIMQTAVGNGNISTGDQEVAQKWSMAIYEHYQAGNATYRDELGRLQSVVLDGIIYRCKSRPAFSSVALYERAKDSLGSSPLLDDPLSADWFRDYIEKGCAAVGLGILPRSPAGSAPATAKSA